MAAFALVPVGFVVWTAGRTGWAEIVALLVRPRVGELVWNTLALEAATLPPCVLIAVGAAWLTERTDLPFSRFWSWLAVAPLAVPAFVQSYAWVTVAPLFHGLWAAVAISVLAYAPFLYLPVAAQLRRMDPGLEEAAASLGLSPWRVFLHVVLPQLRLAICAGALLVALHLLGEFGLYAMIRFDTFTTAIMDQFQSAYDAPTANMLGGVLVVACVALMQAEGWIRGAERYARVGSGAAKVLRRRTLGVWIVPCLIGLCAVGALSLGVPLFVLGGWLVAGGWAAWTPQLASAMEQTGLLSLGGAVMTTAAALPMAWLAVRAPGRTQRGLEWCHTYVGSLPGVVIGLALVTVTVRVALPLYQTYLTLMLAYALLYLPRALAGLRPSLAQAPLELEQAATALGRSPVRAVWSITMRLAAPGMAASLALVALGAFTELTATLMLAPNGVRTLATEFWALSSELDYAAAAPYAAAMVLASAPLTALLHFQSLRMSGR